MKSVTNNCSLKNLTDVDEYESTIVKNKKDLKTKYLYEDSSKVLTKTGLFNVIKTFYQKNKELLKKIGVKDLDHFFNLINSVLDDKIKNKHIRFADGEFYSKISNGNGELVEDKVNYLDDLLQSGGIKQLLDIYNVGEEITKDNEKFLKEIGMTEVDFMEIMKTSIANNAVISFRPISGYAKHLLESGAMGKLFNTKGKSSIIGPLKGVVPYLSCFSKVSKKIDDKNDFENNNYLVKEFQKKNDLDINKSNWQFYKLMLIKILGSDYDSDAINRLSTIDLQLPISSDPSLFNEKLLKEVVKFCRETKQLDFIEKILKEKEFCDNEDIKKDLLTIALKNINTEKNKKDFVNTIDNLNLSSKKEFEVNFDFGGGINKKCQLYFAEENKNPLYEKDSNKIEDNQRPLFFIMEGDDLYQYNYNYISGNIVGDEEYIKLDDHKKNQYLHLLKKVEVFSYCKYQYDENTHDVIEIKRPITADYDMLSAVSQNIFPLRLNSSKEIIDELKYFQFQEAMNDIKFLILLETIYNKKPYSSDDEEFMMRKIKELRMISNSDKAKQLENLERILMLKFGGGKERIRRVRNFIEKEIAVFQQVVDRSIEIKSTLDAVYEIVGFSEIKYNYQNYKTAVDTLLRSENNDVKNKYILILGKSALLSKDNIALDQKSFEKISANLQKAKKVLNGIKKLEEIKELNNLEEMATKIKNFKSELGRKMTTVELEKDRILQVMFDHPDIQHYLESSNKIDVAQDDKFLFEQLKYLEEKSHDEYTRQIQKDVENKKLVIIERLIEKVQNKEKLNDSEKNIAQVIISEFVKKFCDNNKSNIDFSEFSQFFNEDNSNEKIRNLEMVIDNLFPRNRSKTLRPLFENSLQKLFEGKEISKNEQYVIVENITKLEKYRKLEITKSTIYEDLSGVTTINDRVFVAALKFDAHENINHGMEYGNPYPEPFGDGNFVFLLPEGEVKLVQGEQQVCNLVNQLRKKGYPIMINVKWGWISDTEGNLSIPKNKFNFGKVEKAMAKTDQENINPSKSLDLNARLGSNITNTKSMMTNVNTFEVDNPESMMINHDVEEELMRKILRVLRTMKDDARADAYELLLTNYVSREENQDIFDESLKSIESDCDIESLPDKDSRFIKSMFEKIKTLFKEIQYNIKGALKSEDEDGEDLLTKDIKEIRNTIDKINKNTALILDKIENVEKIVGKKSNIKKNKSNHFVNFKNVMCNSIFIDRALSKEEVAKISEEQSYIYNLYLHICNMETSPQMIYGELKDHLMFEKDRDRNALFLDENLQNIKNKVQKNFNDDDKDKILELRLILKEKWKEYSKLSGCRAIFKESDFDKEFKKVIIDISPNNNLIVLKTTHLLVDNKFSFRTL